MTRHAAPTVGRLIDHARATVLVDAFAPLAAGGGLAIVDPDGTVVAGSAPSPPAAVVRDLRTRDGAVIGGVTGATDVPPAVMHALATAVEAVLAEVEERRSVALDDAARRELEQEVRLGRRIQRSLLPQHAPDVPGWSFGTHYEPARQVGGDFYDVFRMRDLPGSVGLVIADVTGKGIAAALLMAFARPLLRAVTDQYRDPATVLTQVNRMLVIERPTPLFITAFIGVLDTATGVLRYASAGHEPPLLAPAGARRVRRLAEGGALLGAFPSITPGDHLTQLHPGDLLLLHTDGAIDARDPAGRRFGDLRLARTVGASRGQAADALVQRVAEAVTRFSGGTPPADDIALLAVGRDGP